LDTVEPLSGTFPVGVEFFSIAGFSNPTRSWSSSFFVLKRSDRGLLWLNSLFLLWLAFIPFPRLSIALYIILPLMFFIPSELERYVRLGKPESLS